MNNHKPAVLGRRQFLKSAAILAGAAAFDLPQQARALVGAGDHSVALRLTDANIGCRSQGATSLAYWNGRTFVDPRLMARGDRSLMESGVSVLLHDHYVPNGASPVLSACSPIFHIEADGDTIPVPFCAWSVSSSKPRNSRFYMPVVSSSGILLQFQALEANGRAESHFLSVGDELNSPKLRCGTYAIVASALTAVGYGRRNGVPDWRGHSLLEENGAKRISRACENANFEYLLMTVTKA